MKTGSALDRARVACMPDTPLRSLFLIVTTTVFCRRSMRRFEAPPRRWAPKRQIFIIRALRPG